MKNVLGLKCDILENGNLNCQSVIFFWLERKNFAVLLAIGYYGVLFKKQFFYILNSIAIGLISFVLKQKYIWQTGRPPVSGKIECIQRSLEVAKKSHMVGPVGTQSLAVVGGALTPSFQAYEKPYSLELLSGKLAAIQTCQKQEKFCIWGYTGGNSAPDVRRGAGKFGLKEKRGTVSRLSY